MAGDITGSASREGRSMDRFVANTASTVATANNADTEHPNRDRSREHMPVLEGREHLSQAKQAG
jgi:hypothetical protein